MAYKHDYDKILTRITKILYKLNDGDELSVKDLAEEFNTSTRTIQCQPHIIVMVKWKPDIKMSKLPRVFIYQKRKKSIRCYY